MKTCFILTGLLVLAVLAGCVDVPRKTGEPVPLTEEEIAFLEKLRDPKIASVIEETPELFFNLNQMLTAWQESYQNKKSKKHVRIYTSLEAMLTRWVYLNFDKIMVQLEEGSQPNRVIAATALGFCRIPDDPDFPQVYPLAIEALLRAIESGDDAITQNALLGLRLLEDSDTPLMTILPLMTQHHNPEVRANAALCLSVIVTPDEADYVMPFVLPALKDEEPKVRNHAVSIIRQLNDAGALKALIELMEDRYELIRANAARTMGELGDPEACGALISQIDHPNELVQMCCHDALVKLTDKDYGFDQEKWTEWWIEFRSEQGVGR